MKVDPGGLAQPYVTQLAVVEQEYPGSTAVSLAEPRDDHSPTIVSVTTADGEGRDVFVDPYQLQGAGVRRPRHDALRPGDPAARRSDGRDVGRPRHRGGRLLGVRDGADRLLPLRPRVASARRRARKAGRRGAKLRYRHGLVGSVVGIGLLTLLVTGLPWTGFWGEKVQSFATERGSSMWSLDPGAQSDPASTLDESLPHGHQDVPWAQGDSPVPEAPADGGEQSVANVDTAITVADQEGIRHPMTVALPEADDATGVFSVIGYAFDAPSDERTVHVGRYGGEVESTYGFGDYPLLAKVVSQGIGLHEGRSLGLWSFWGSASMCLAVMFMCVTGPLMWWRRRPRGAARIGAPRGRMPLRATPLLLVALVALGVFLPFFGITLLAALLVDQLVLRRVPALSHWFGTT